MGESADFIGSGENSVQRDALWQYALATYQRNGVAALCLAIQEDLDADVLLVLLAGFLAERGVAITAGRRAELAARAQPLKSGLIQPLRALRRACKPSGAEGSDFAYQHRAYAGLKAAELDAERWQLALLSDCCAGWSAELAPQETLLASNITAVVPDIDARTLAALVDALAG